MKPSSFQRLLRGHLPGLLSWAATLHAAAAVLTVTPNLITNDYVGKITVTVTGLPAGQSVLVERYGDFNANGAINAGEPLIQAAPVTDGQKPTLGGVRNLNVPGDEDGAVNGQVRVELNYPGGEAGLDLVAGKYVVRVSAPSGGFTAVTAPLEIRQKVQSQGAKGRITAAGTGLGVANVPVVLLPMDSEPVAGTLTDASGNYTLYAPPGGYTVLALSPGHVADFSGQVMVSAGALSTVNLSLTAATRTISGKVKDRASGKGIPGVFVQAQTETGRFAGAFSGTDGAYSVAVVADSWGIAPSGGSLTQLGYLGWRDRSGTSTAGGNVTGLDLPVDPATALVYGTVRNRLGAPVPGVGIYGSDTARQYDVYGPRSFPPNGDYCVGVGPGNWWVGPDPTTLAALGYVGVGSEVTLAANQALRQDFILDPVTAHLAGRVIDENGAALAGVVVHASDQKGASNDVNADGDGNFSIGVTAGSWILELGEDDSAQRQLVSPQLPYQLVDGQTRSGIVLVARHATASIHGRVQTPIGVPVPNVSVYGSINRQGTNYFVQTRTDGDGNYQLRSFNGTWGVSLDCDDLQPQGYECVGVTSATVAGADVTLNIVVQTAAPLQVATSSLPGATPGAYYQAQLQASGGQGPYLWSLAPGSAPLPPGLGLAADGRIFGTAGGAGMYLFNVRVTDSRTVTADALLSIVVTAPTLQVATSTLADGHQGVGYVAQLQASGGQAPYAWSIAPGSLGLPADLHLGADGTLSGTPGVVGTFAFIVQVTDGGAMTANRALTLTLHPPPTLTALGLVGNQLQLRLTGAAGHTYTVQYVNRLGDSNWSRLLTLDLSAATATILDPDSVGTSRFYRVRVGP